MELVRGMANPAESRTCGRFALTFFGPFCVKTKRAEDDVYAGKQKKEKKTKKVTATRQAWAARLGELNVYILNTLYRRY